MKPVTVSTPSEHMMRHMLMSLDQITQLGTCCLALVPSQPCLETPLPNTHVAGGSRITEPVVPWMGSPPWGRDFPPGPSGPHPNRRRENQNWSVSPFWRWLGQQGDKQQGPTPGNVAQPLHLLPDEKEHIHGTLVQERPVPRMRPADSNRSVCAL